MATQSFNCPNCGAPLDYDDSGEATMHCPYCNTSVVVPPEIRGKPEKSDESEDDFTPPPAPVIDEVDHWQSRRSGRIKSPPSGCILSIIFIALAIAVGVPIYFSIQAANEASQQINAAFSFATELPTRARPTEIPTPTLAPTPGYLIPERSFGKKGIGEGMLDSAIYIAVDGEDNLYVSSYKGGRIQVFDSTGKFLRQFFVGDDKTNLHGIAVTRDGVVYVSYGNAGVYRYNSVSGKQTGLLPNPAGANTASDIGALAITPNGDIAAVWYESRWGMITSLEGHGDGLIVFDPSGKIVRTIKPFLSGQTDNPEVETTIAIDGKGTLYALTEDDNNVYKFAPDGKFLDRFPLTGKNGSATMGNAIAVDGQGRVYIATYDGILVYSPEGVQIDEYEPKNKPDMMAFDANDNMWTVSRDTVTEFNINPK